MRTEASPGARAGGRLCYGGGMDMALVVDIVGVCGFFLAAASLIWQVCSQRVRLQVEIDEDASDFVTTKMPPLRSTRSPPQPVPCTVVRLALTIANVSRRPNTVVEIDLTTPATLDVPSVTTVVDVSAPWEGPAHWGQCPEWTPSHSLAPGERHAAWMYYIVSDSDRVWKENTSMRITVRVKDAYSKTYNRTAALRHRDASDL